MDSQSFLVAKYCFYLDVRLLISQLLWPPKGYGMLRADRDKISTTTWQQILQIKCSNPFKQLCLLLLSSPKNALQVNERDILLVFHSHAKNDGNVRLLRFERHLCIFVHHEVHDGREEKQEERQELLVLILRYFSFLRALRSFVVQPGFSPKLSGRKNQTRCG